MHFCACGKQLDRRLEGLGARRFADRVDVHKEDLPAIDKWLAGLTAALPSMQLKTFEQLGGMAPFYTFATHAIYFAWAFLSIRLARSHACILTTSEASE